MRYPKAVVPKVGVDPHPPWIPVGQIFKDIWKPEYLPHTGENTADV